MTASYETISTRLDGNVLSATFHSPPINLIGPEVVRDLVGLLEELSRPVSARVVVFDSMDPDFFFPHVDLAKVPAYTAEAAKAPGPGDASLGMLFRRLSEVPAVTIAKLRGRARGAGSEFLLACDMRFASRENAVVGQPEVGIGTPARRGSDPAPHPSVGPGPRARSRTDVGRLRCRTRRTLRMDQPRGARRRRWTSSVAGLAARIGDFPRDALIAAKAAINAIALPTPADVRADAALFQQLVRGEAAQQRMAELFKRCLQTRGRTELDLGDALGGLKAAD